MEALLAALGLVFLAELGDKTQLVVLVLGPGRRLGPTLAGLFATIALLQALAVGAGRLLTAIVPETALGVGSGLLFLGFGLWTWWAADDDLDDDGPQGGLAAFLVAFFLAELGDKSSLATALLASTNDPLATWVGATLGFFGATLVSLAAGSWLRARVPTAVLRRLGAAAFGVAGTITIALTLTT